MPSKDELTALTHHDDELEYEWAVPCLESNCRSVYENREGAEAYAERSGGVVEVRLVSPWRPVQD